MMLTVEEENLLSMYVDEDGDRRNAIFDLQEAAILCDDYDMLYVISTLISKLERMTDDEYFRLAENITFTEPED